MNNKGFAVSGIIYGILVLFIILMVSLLSMFNNRKNTLDELQKRVENEFNNKVDTEAKIYSSNDSFVPVLKGYYKLEINNNGINMTTIVYLNKEETLNIVIGDTITINNNSENLITLSSTQRKLSTNKEFIDTTITTTTNTDKNVSIKFLNTKVNDSLDNVRYIMNCIHGNNKSTNNSWIELKAISSGVNVAYSKPVTGSSTSPNITDNNLINEVTLSTGKQCIIVDLGKKYNLEAISVYHSTDSTLKFYADEISVSSDGYNYQTVYYYEENESEFGINVNAFNKEGMKVGNEYVPIKDFGGAKWLRVFHHNNLGTWGSLSQVRLSSGHHTDYLQSILSHLEKYRNTNGKFEFLLEYDGKSGYNRWIQTSNPTSLRESVTGYSQVKISWNTGALNNTFGGLCLSSSNSTFIDGTCGHNNYFYAIGLINKWNGGIPGYDTTTAITTSVDLWVRIDNVDLD